jgi:secondary thiamine-phosphate synthase enzyme
MANGCIHLRFLLRHSGRVDFVDLTSRVEEAARGSGVNEGMALVFASHVTGVLILNEYDRDLLKDLKGPLRRLLPAEGDYRHHGNAHTHLRSMFFTPKKSLARSRGA